MWSIVTGCGKTAEQRAKQRQDAGILAVRHNLGIDVGLLFELELHVLRVTPRPELDDFRAVSNDLRGFLVYAPMTHTNEAETGVDRPDAPVMASNEAESETGSGGSRRAARADVPAMAPNEEDLESGRELIVEVLSDVGAGDASPTSSPFDGNLAPLVARNPRERLADQTTGDVKVIF
jgi:hypothetical protein